MAIYHVAGQILRRSEGHSTVAAASYRARTEMLDKRTNERHDYTRIAKDLRFEGMFMPKGAPAWAAHREAYWNRVERMETRKDAQLAHELNIALPHELTVEQQRYAIQDWAKEITRKGYVVDVAIHAAHDWGDERNDHAHVMIALRKIDVAQDGLSRTKDRYTLASLGEQMDHWRERWSHHANRHLARAGHEVEIDHRSLEDQGIDRKATVHLGKDSAALERRGIETARGDENRQVIETEKEKARLAAEIAELERLYALEQAGKIAEVQKTPAFQPDAVPEHIVSVTRPFRVERRPQPETMRPRRQRIKAPAKALLGTIRSLARTMAAGLAGIVSRGECPDLLDDPKSETSKPQTQAVKLAPGVVKDEITLLRHDRPGTASPAERLQAWAGEAATTPPSQRQESERAAAPQAQAAPELDILETIRRERLERMRDLARSMPRPDRSRELVDDELEL